jgi:hypothetical protein
MLPLNLASLERNNMADKAPKPESVEAKKRGKPGHVRKQIDIPEESWKKIAAHIEQNDLDETKYLRRLLVETAAGM